MQSTVRTTHTHPPEHSHSRATGYGHVWICSRALAALFFLSGALAPAQSLDSVLADTSFTPDEQTQIETVFDLAREAGVPDELLLPRLTEGIAKRVPADRLADALEGEVSSLLEVRLLLAEVEAEELLEDAMNWARTAILLKADVEESAVQVLASAAIEHHQNYRPASTLMMSLIDWGLDHQRAAALAGATVSSQIDPDQYPVVLDVLIRGRLRRVDLDEMVEALLETLPTVASTRELIRATRW